MRIYYMTDWEEDIGIDVTCLSSAMSFEALNMEDWIGPDLDLIDWDKIGTR